MNSLSHTGALHHRVVSLLIENPQLYSSDKKLIARVWMDEMTEQGRNLRTPYPMLLEKMIQGELSDAQEIVRVKRAYEGGQIKAVKYRADGEKEMSDNESVLQS